MMSLANEAISMTQELQDQRRRKIKKNLQGRDSLDDVDIFKAQIDADFDKYIRQES
jgi:hypothetical protein